MKPKMMRALCAIVACALTLLVGCGGGGDAGLGEQTATPLVTAANPPVPVSRSQLREHALAVQSGWDAGVTPTNPSASDTSAVNLGVKFRTGVAGVVTGVRFYKGVSNTGTHVGSLWSSSGQLLASATFSGETATGWQQVNFSTPVSIAANTVYVVSYLAPNGGYAFDSQYFLNNGVVNGSVELLQSGVSGGNGVYAYGTSNAFPALSFNATNYWVDVVFDTGPAGPDTTPPVVNTRTPTVGATGVGVGSTVRATFSEPIDPTTVSTSTFELRNAANALVAAAVNYDVASLTATLTPTGPLAVSSTYTATLRGGGTDPRIKDTAGNSLAASTSWSFTTAAGGSGCCTGFGESATPTNPSSTDASAVELGVKFRTNVDGFVTGVRFYKGTGNTGTHVGNLWTSSGTLLATATFSNETASGWQQVSFASPVAIAANTVYVASYFAPNGRFAFDGSYFANSGVVNGPVELLQNGVSGPNGVFAYGTAASFPAQSFNATNYWVDLVFEASGGPDVTAPTVVSTTPASGATDVAVATTTVRATFNERLDASTVASSTFELRNSANAIVPATVTYDAVSRTATLTPSSTLALSTAFTATVRGGATDPRIKDEAGNALASNVVWSFTTEAATPCQAPVNTVVAENCQIGNPSSEWDVVGAGDTSIQGYATQISVNRGSTVQFKVNTNVTAYRIDVYRLGYYGGAGARKVATVQPTATLPQSQPGCLNDATTGLVDCGNWSVSASWAVPASAASGIYIARLVRADNGGASHMAFIVRNDASTSELLFKTSDSTWQAYNDYGGNSLYVGSPAGRAYKVSYNRPFANRGNQYRRAWLFGAEYPMVRWLEANGYDVSYFAGVDIERSSALVRNHRVLLSVGHDEYWSAGQRASAESARDNGVHLAFLSGNEMFWKTRWENSIDGSSTPYRTLVSYKETQANAKIDPTGAWTGTWRDPRFSPPADGARPENALTGTIFTINCCVAESIEVTAATGLLRFWRNTSVAALPPGAVATLQRGMIGYEADEDLDNGFRPPGLFRLSATALSGVSKLQDFGSTYASGNATHSLTMYRHTSGALVFGAGTVRWSWGLDGNHDADASTPFASTTPDPAVQQATVNLFADMNAQPGSLRPGLVATTASADVTLPGSVITAPAGGATLAQGAPTTISGTATDIGGVVAGVEVSVDGGTTWRMANGRSPWTYSWTPTAGGAVTVRSRSVDDSGNIQSSVASVSVTVGGADTTAPTVTARSPAVGATGVAQTANVTVTFSEAMDAATISASTIELRDAANALVAATVSYDAATRTATLDPAPTLAAGVSYTATVRGGTADPRVKDLAGNALQTSAAWSFTTATAGGDTTPPTIAGRSPAVGATGVARSANVTVTFSEAMDAATISASTIELRDAANALVAATVSYDAATGVATLDPTPTLASQLVYTVRVRGGTIDPRVKDVAGNALGADSTWTFTTEAASSCPCTIWPATATPSLDSVSDSASVNLGVKFSSDVAGSITGIRFFKGAANTGTHVGTLWSSGGQQLAQATFTSETASGWQQVSFAAPVAIAANTTYVASYLAPVGRYAFNGSYFTAAGVDNSPLRALSDSAAAGNGVYVYASASSFPNLSFNASNYWVDVVFTTSVADTTAPTVTARSPAVGATGVAQTANVTVTFSEAMDAATISASTIELRDAANALVAATVSYDAATRTATLDPAPTLAAGVSYTATVRGGTADPRVKDLAGNALQTSAAWSFTTATAGDTTPPTIMARSPAIGATGVSRTANMTVTFSEAMSSATISAITFELRDPANNLVAGAVSYDSTTRVATLNPTPTLAALTTYTVRVIGGAAGVKDVAGNPLAANVTWTFTTVADTIAPTISSRSPASGATGVSATTNVVVTFNEDMDSTTINTTTVQLRNPAGTVVTAVVTYNTATRQATLSPPVTLAAFTIYTVTVRGGTTDPRVKDGAGNALASTSTWQFRTQ